MHVLAQEERVSGRIVLDDLPWDAISCMHGSRDPDQCRNKWTGQLSPSMVDRGARQIPFSSYPGTVSTSIAHVTLLPRFACQIRHAGMGYCTPDTVLVTQNSHKY